MSEPSNVQPPRIYSIGHSNRSLDQLIELLRAFGVATLVDVRRFPGSRRLPHFARSHLERALPEARIGYQWMEQLGGRRKGGGADSPNQGLRAAGFRAYADHMRTEPFRRAVEQVIETAREGPAALMCAEALYWKCHRRLISDHLLARGITVQHIMGPGKRRPHEPTPTARIAEGEVTYPAPLFSEADRSTG